MQKVVDAERVGRLDTFVQGIISTNHKIKLITTNLNIVEGSVYAAFIPTGTTIATIPLTFKDTFNIFDPDARLSGSSILSIDFSAYGQGVVSMQTAGDNLTFYYKVGDGWYCIGHSNPAYTRRV